MYRRPPMACRPLPLPAPWTVPSPQRQAPVRMETTTSRSRFCNPGLSSVSVTRTLLSKGRTDYSMRLTDITQAKNMKQVMTMKQPVDLKQSVDMKQVMRSEERRVGKECVSTYRVRWARDNKKKK